MLSEYLADFPRAIIAEPMSTTIYIYMDCYYYIRLSNHSRMGKLPLENFQLQIFQLTTISIDALKIGWII